MSESPTNMKRAESAWQGTQALDITEGDNAACTIRLLASDEAGWTCPSGRALRTRRLWVGLLIAPTDLCYSVRRWRANDQSFKRRIFLIELGTKVDRNQDRDTP